MNHRLSLVRKVKQDISTEYASCQKDAVCTGSLKDDGQTISLMKILYTYLVILSQYYQIQTQYYQIRPQYCRPSITRYVVLQTQSHSAQFITRVLCNLFLQIQRKHFDKYHSNRSELIRMYNVHYFDQCESNDDVCL